MYTRPAQTGRAPYAEVLLGRVVQLAGVRVGAHQRQRAIGAQKQRRRYPDA